MLAVWIRRRREAAAARVVTPASAAPPPEPDGTPADSTTVEVALLGEDPFVVHVARLRPPEGDSKPRDRR